ncbi:MAG: HEPN domain-containing protein [Clostridia bacterium]|nr:HEPN domain-containing protein [Clostridia bacterium]
MENYELEWIKFSKMDLDVANRELNREEDESLILTPMVCFHCQQSVEKALKAYLVKNKIDFGKIHNLETLRKMCSEVDKEFESLEFEELNYYGVAIRYPDGLMEMPTFSQAKKLYELSVKITTFIFDKIG